MYKLSIAAVRDFDTIYEYTVRAFGKTQARDYRDTLKNACAKVAETPLIAPVYPHTPGIRRFTIGQHSIYFQIRESEILIVRILHQQMDAPTHI